MLMVPGTRVHTSVSYRRRPFLTNTGSRRVSMIGSTQHFLGMKNVMQHGERKLLLLLLHRSFMNLQSTGTINNNDKTDLLLLILSRTLKTACLVSTQKLIM